MALRELLLPWSSQPQEAVGPAIELGQDALLWSAVNPTLLLGAAAPAGSDASGSRSIGAPGIGRAWTRNANAGSLFGTFQHVSGLEITVAVVAAPVASSNRKVAFSQRTSASNAAQWYVGFNSDAGAGASSGSMSIISRSTAGTFPSSLAVGSQFDGGAHAWVCALGVGGGYVYRDGALQGTTGAAVSGTIWTSAQVTRIGNIGDYATDGLFVCDDPIYLVIVWPRVLPSEAARLLSSELAKNLGSAFHPQNIWVPVAAGGGGTWSVSLTESASASDSLGGATTALVSLIESASAADIITAATIAAVALIEAASASDTQTASYSATGSGSVTESASAADTLDAATTMLRALTETASADDQLAAATTMLRAISESASAADTPAASYSGAGAATIEELTSATDALTAAATLLAVIVEAGNATDAATAAATVVAMLTETAVATDSASAAAPGTWNVSIVELAAAVDAVHAYLTGDAPRLSANPIGRVLSATRRPAAVSTTRRPASLSTRTR